MTKCDEKKPACGTCVRLGIVCESVKLDLKFRVVTAPPPKKTGARTEPAKPDSSRLGLQLFSQHSRSSQIPNINLAHSLQHTDRDVFYSTYWEDHCLPALHPIFRCATELLGFPALKDTILALSSCNISRIYAERKFSTSFATMGTLSPNLIHQTRSQLYYSSAIKRFISLTQDDHRNNAAEVLTILVLFGYIEASMGNFDGYYCHVQGLSAFLVELRETTGYSLYRSLLISWLQSQFLVWWARTYFSSLDVQLNMPSIDFPGDLEGTSDCLHDLRAVVLSILCESHRLNVKETLKHWRDQTGFEPALASDLQSDRDDMEGRLARLEDESKRLDEWLLYLPPSEQPPVGDASETLPILFQAHDAALNFAYYVVARIMQCTSFLHNLPCRDAQHLGRFSGLLLAASLRCQDLSLGMQIEKWLQTLEEKQPTEEGAFPVYQALAVVKAINRQRTMGRDVFGVSQAMDDGGGMPKFTHYNSQMITTILVHGKWRSTGDLFTECIDLQ
ncbi:hypothetical protein N7491_009749 [Penicillium cf. griseofulvum]|uniref:Zn(2)-C6 fungal-type domain-containing protein n=1 Tax=Penicillium cf. griseofulvum TaxID=2972120 RepID=A0A9W9MYJ3_9EURO|nr:hypothetical protein N7472_000078 [Penicillium cf. griseofulvum]KAJ5421304.1 hypothetical protein N7491_009749 [Penicillium cf. griseofulvum]